jgi:hypothetical protein
MAELETLIMDDSVKLNEECWLASRMLENMDCEVLEHFFCLLERWRVSRPYILDPRPQTQTLDPKP